MKTWRNLGSERPALTSCRATPLPQSMTYSESFTTITWQAETFSLRGRGPPPVPSRMSRVFACARRTRGSMAAAVTARNARRSMSASREQLHQPVKIFEAVVERLDAHALVLAVDAHVVNVARETRMSISRNARIAQE